MTLSVTPSLRSANPWPLHASADSFNDTLYDDSPVLDLRTRSRTHIRQHLQRHLVWQPRLGFANPWPLHTPTPPTTPCVTAEPWPLHTPHNTSTNTLCDSPVLDLRTLTPTHTRRHLQPVWQPGLGSANPDPHTHTHQTAPPTTPCVTAPPATNPQNRRTLTPPTWSKIAKAIWGNTNTVAPDSFSNKQKTQTQNSNTQTQKNTNTQTHKNTNTQKHKRANTEKHKHADTQKTPKHNHTMYLIQSATPYYKALRTTKHDSVLQSTAPVLLCTTKYHAVLQSTIPAPFRTARYYKVLLQHYSVLQSTTPVLLCTT